jgi:uncharacterized membrane protein YsdA (DUF1294 family)/cold shock CspA family protein
MGQQGRLAEWNDERGFGFIDPLDGGARVFVHVSEFPRSDRRPMALDLLTYDVDRDDRGRLRATGVRFLAPVHARVGTSQVEASSTGGLSVAVAVSASFLVLIAVLALAGVAPLWVLGLYVLLSVVLFAAYGADKSAAQHGRWRTSESSLHLLALAGGWPGALVAQRVFRHKTIKQPFQGIFWGTVVGNCLLLAMLLVATAAAPG